MGGVEGPAEQADPETGHGRGAPARASATRNTRGRMPSPVTPEIDPLKTSGLLDGAIILRVVQPGQDNTDGLDAIFPNPRCIPGCGPCANPYAHKFRGILQLDFQCELLKVPSQHGVETFGKAPDGVFFDFGSLRAVNVVADVDVNARGLTGIPKSVCFAEVHSKIVD